MIERLKGDLFDKQLNFIEDASPLKAALTTRRAGKSYAAATDMVMDAVDTPGCSILYTGLTLTTAVRIIWKDCIKKICKKHRINATLNRKDFEIHFPAFGSVIYILGVDATEEQRNKAMGQKFKKVYCDESALYRHDMETFIYETMLPAVADYRGTICMIGMPDKNTHSFFFDVTNSNVDGWSVHKWSCADNPHVADQMREQIERLKRTKPGIENTPGYKNMWLGEWAVDASDLVYKYDPAKNSIPALPLDRWYYVLGIDLGFDDPTAFVLSAYRDYDPNLYIIEAYKRSGMIISEVADVIKSYDKRFAPHHKVIDNASKQAVEEMKQRHQLNLVAAEKAGKADFIQVMNSDFEVGRIKLVAAQCEPLIQEYQTLIWDKRKRAKGIFMEDAMCKNHCADGGLYAWRHCFNYVDRGTQPNPHEPEEDRIERALEEEAEEIASNSSKQFWE